MQPKQQYILFLINKNPELGKAVTPLFIRTAEAEDLESEVSLGHVMSSRPT